MTIVTVESVFDMKSGDMCKFDEYGWMIMCPGCPDAHVHLTPKERPWDVIEHEDGTITVNPSIWHKDDCNAHFFIKKNKIQWC